MAKQTVQIRVIALHPTGDSIRHILPYPNPLLPETIRRVSAVNPFAPGISVPMAALLLQTAPLSSIYKANIAHFRHLSTNFSADLPPSAHFRKKTVAKRKKVWYDSNLRVILNFSKVRWERWPTILRRRRA